MLEVAARNRPVDRVEPQRQVRGQHVRHMLLRRIVRVRDRGGGIFRLPLLRTGGALRQLPFVVEQIVEEVIAPLRRCLRPRDLRAAGDGVRPEAAAMPALPAEALILDVGAFGLRADKRRIAGAVGFAEGVAAGDERDRLLVVHRHPLEGFPDVVRGCHEIGLAVRPFRIDVDKSHLHGAERILQLAFAAVAFVAKPGSLGTPVEFLGFPRIHAAAAETERLEAHQLQGDVADENRSRSAQDIFRPYFCLIGQSSRRALSRFALSGQLFSGAKRCWPPPAPPRPSAIR